MTDLMTDLRQYSPSAQRNGEPILAVLRDALPPAARVLEIASGSGEHAMRFAAALPQVDWQPSDADPRARESVAGWIAHTGITNVRQPLDLDVERLPWGIERADAIVCINMLHISPWSAAQALFDGAARVLGERGVLFLYGPYKRRGAHTSPGNEAFDLQLRDRNPLWGVRDMEAVVALGDAVGFACGEPVAMPANNFSLVLRRR